MAQRNPNEPFTRVSINDAEEMMSGSDVQVVDVRDPFEFSSGHVPGALHIPINPVTGFMRRKDELPSDKPIIFVCAVGQRSALACEVAASMGFTNLFNLEGGTDAWVKAGKPVDR
jgi:rhodanese-related sulfurtransferase